MNYSLELQTRKICWPSADRLCVRPPTYSRTVLYYSEFELNPLKHSLHKHCLT